MLGLLALLSLGLTLWQYVVARRFPLHQRVADARPVPAVTMLKPLKGCDAETARCLRSWLTQAYAAPVQILFGVADADDPAAPLVQGLIAKHPGCDAQLVICGEKLGANAKVSTLIQLERLARHDVLIISDADVRVPPDLLANLVAPLHEERVGLVNCFYELANPVTLAMRWEAVCVNADFWSQVLQARSLRPLDFALGAVMAVKREALRGIGGFVTLADQLADDYQLGHLIAGQGRRIELCPVVVQCWESPQSWGRVWRHQLRWARTIRVCQPGPYFFSLLSNATLWPALFLCATNESFSNGGLWHFSIGKGLLVFGVCLMVRVIIALSLQMRLTRTSSHVWHGWLVPVKDLFSAVIWALSFLGNHVEWRGERYRVLRGGRLTKD